MRGLTLAGLLAFTPLSLSAQWSIGLSLGIARYTGGAVSTVDSMPGAVRPYRPTTVTLVVGHDWGALRADLGVGYGEPGLAAEIPGGAFLETKDAHFLAAAPEITVRVLRVGSAGLLRVGGGGDFTLWSVTGLDPRILGGAHVAVVYEWQVAGPLLGSIQAGASLSPSLFQESEVPSDFARRSMIRPSIGVGLRWRP